MTGFGGNGQAILQVVRNALFRIGCGVYKTDFCVVGKAPQPVVLGSAFQFTYDVGTRGRDRIFSILVVKKRAIWALMTDAKRNLYPDAERNPERVQFRQTFQDIGASDGNYSVKLKYFTLHRKAAVTTA